MSLLNDCLERVTEAIRSNKMEMEPLSEVPGHLIVAWRGEHVVAMVTIVGPESTDSLFTAVAVTADGYGADIIGLTCEVTMRRADTGETRESLLAAVANRAGDVLVHTQLFQIITDFIGAQKIEWGAEHTNTDLIGGYNGTMGSYLKSLMLDELTPNPLKFPQWARMSRSERDNEVTRYLVDKFRAIVMVPDDEDGLTVFMDPKDKADLEEIWRQNKDTTEETN